VSGTLATGGSPSADFVVISSRHGSTRRGTVKKFFVVAAGIPILAFSTLAAAQGKGAVVVGQTEAIVKVVTIDRNARTVTFRGPRGNEVTMNVPKEAQNLDRVKPGATFRVRYVEAVAVGVTKGGQASAGTEKTVQLAPRGGTPGGVVVNTSHISAEVVAIDYANREVALRGPQGRVRAFKVADQVQSLNEVKVGDTVAVVYAEALALEMVSEPGPKAKATPK
jgi:hypothetical protein